ncbi:MAG: ATP-binding protein [Phycisphaeraceae bacterium JB051]
MNKINQTLDMLFNGNTTPVDESGALVWLMQQAQWLAPTALWAMDTGNTIVATCYATNRFSKQDLLHLSKPFEQTQIQDKLCQIRLRDVDYTVFQLAASDHGQLFALLDRKVNEDLINKPCYTDLFPAAEFVLKHIMLNRRSEVSQRRVRQLQSERLTLQSTYHQVLIDSLAEGAKQNERLEKLVTERSKDLKDALLYAEQANQTKSLFLANMSHEIRTPLTAIIGYADLMMDTQLSPEIANWVSIVQRNSQHLLAIVNDILDLSKIESGKLQVERMPMSPVEMVDELLQALKPSVQEKDICLDVQYLTELPSAVYSDPTRVRQILTNLLGNAVKFTESGFIHVKMAVVVEGNKPEVLKIDVIDTGIGMAEDQLEKIFAPFTQADISTTRRFGGTGLGLTISKQLAKRLGGDLTAISELGKGSTFTLTIPNHIPAQANTLVHSENTPANKQMEGKQTMSTPQSSVGTIRVLLAEDGPDNQNLISLVLKMASMKVDIAENGQIAYDMATQAEQQGNPYHVILMDMQMPVLDGLAATQKLRQSGYTGKIISLTANAMESDRKRCLDAGCDDYTCKPINREKLVQIVVEHATASHAATPAADAAEPSQARETSPLVSDFAGDPDMAELIEDYVSHLPERAAAISEAIATEQMDVLRTLAHQVKGSAGGYGFGPITEQAAQVEALLHQEAQLQDIRKQVDALIELCNRASAY